MPYVLSAVLIQFYSGVLLSYLTVKNFNPPFKDLEGVIKDGSYKVSAIKATRVWNYFQVSWFLKLWQCCIINNSTFLQTDPGAQAAAIRKNSLIPPNKLPEDAQIGFDQLCDNNRWVFLCNAFDKEIQAKCNVLEIKRVIFYEPVGIIVKKGFPYKEVMTKM